MSEELIAEGLHVVVRKCDGGHQRAVKVTKHKIVLIEKLKFFLDKAIGAPLGSSFLVRKQQVSLAESPDESSLEEEAVNGVEEESGLDLDGEFRQHQMFILEVDEKQSAQSLSYESLLEMRKTGVSGQTIVSKLVEGSLTYSQKTSHAQDKYVRRKKRKHSDTVVVLKPSIRLLADIYYKKDTEKAGGFRLDFLSMMLTQGNVHHGATIAVMEQCQGVLVAGVLERLGGGGRCILLHKGVTPQAIPAVEAMDFAPQVMDALYPVPLSQLFHCEESSEIHMARYFGEEGEEAGTPREPEEEERLRERRERQTQRRARLGEGLRVMGERSVDGALLALRTTHPLSLVKELVKTLRPSSPLVVFAQFIEPLLDCYAYLKDSGLAVNLRLMDSFFRYQQVFPGRTHPEMTQFVPGGFLLFGTVVIPCE